MLVERRERVLANWLHPQRAVKLAALYELEAALWAELFEHTGVRLYWRAALAAEAYARHCAHRWSGRGVSAAARRRAVAQFGHDAPWACIGTRMAPARKHKPESAAARPVEGVGGASSWM